MFQNFLFFKKSGTNLVNVLKGLFIMVKNCKNAYFRDTRYPSGIRCGYRVGKKVRVLRVSGNTRWTP